MPKLKGKHPGVAPKLPKKPTVSKTRITRNEIFSSTVNSRGGATKRMPKKKLLEVLKKTRPEADLDNISVDFSVTDSYYTGSSATVRVLEEVQEPNPDYEPAMERYELRVKAYKVARRKYNKDLELWKAGGAKNYDVGVWSRKRTSMLKKMEKLEGEYSA